MTDLVKYQSEYQMVPYRDDLYNLAVEYHNVTEKFDRSICTGEPRHGDAFPSNDWERGQINKNAKSQYIRLSGEAFKLGFSNKEWKQAVSNTTHSLVILKENKHER